MFQLRRQCNELKTKNSALQLEISNLKENFNKLLTFYRQSKATDTETILALTTLNDSLNLKLKQMPSVPRKTLGESIDPQHFQKRKGEIEAQLGEDYKIVKSEIGFAIKDYCAFARYHHLTESTVKALSSIPGSIKNFLKITKSVS